MNKVQSILRMLLTLTFAILFSVTAQAKKPSYTLAPEPFPVATATSIPGHVLKPGSYSIRIVDDFKDRFILRVDNSQGQTQATFIGVRNADFAPFVALHQQGPIFWTASPRGSTSVRAFSFPGGNTLEFVYPKGEAVALAKLNANSVPAIDPESEGRKPDPKLSLEDREVVTLWTLTATRVGAKEQTPAIEAKRFIAPAEPVAAATQEAQSVPSSAAAIRPSQPVMNRVAANDAPAGVRPVRKDGVGIHPKIERLPQTASQLPLLLLLSLLLLCSAAGVRLRRRIS